MAQDRMIDSIFKLSKPISKIPNDRVIWAAGSYDAYQPPRPFSAGQPSHLPIQPVLAACREYESQLWSFLDLPAEIRTMVYKAYFDRSYILIDIPYPAEMFDGKGAIFWSKMQSWAWLQERQFDPRIWLLFRLSKQIACEAQPIFFSTATFVFKGRKQFLDIFNRLRIPGVPQIIPAASTGSPLRAKLFVGLQHVWIDLTFHRPRPGRENMPEMTRHTASILQILQSHFSDLRSLSITVDRSSKVFKGETSHHADLYLQGWFLKALCRFNHLDHFSFAYSRLKDTDNKRRGLRRAIVISMLDAILKMHIQKHVDGNDVSQYRFIDDQTPIETIEYRVRKEIKRAIFRDPALHKQFTG